jgi:hypothetical protein
MSTPSGTIVNCEQGSPTWREARCGMITASRCADVIATLKKRGKKDPEEAAARRNYRAELIAEILSGVPAEKYVTREMQWGLDQEPFARAAYEMEFDVMVEPGGFITHPYLPRFGCSPDGLVGDDGMVQIKCPTTSTHLGWILSGNIPLEHGVQMLAELAVTGRKWNDFVSYDPRLPRHLQLWGRRFTAKQEHIALLEDHVTVFNAEIEHVLGELPSAMTPPRSAASPTMALRTGSAIPSVAERERHEVPTVRPEHGTNGPRRSEWRAHRVLRLLPVRVSLPATRRRGDCRQWPIESGP